MTCIVGLVHAGEVYIGGDSQAGNEWQVTPQATPKVFRRDVTGKKWVFGYTTSYRMGQIVQHVLIMPEFRYEKHDADSAYAETYMVKEFIPALRTALKEGGWPKTKDGQEEGGNFLVGGAGRLWEVQADYSVLSTGLGYNAVGSGWLVALGALHATHNIPPIADFGPDHILRLALMAAANHTPHVGGPFQFVNTLP